MNNEGKMEKTKSKLNLVEEHLNSLRSAKRISYEKTFEVFINNYFCCFHEGQDHKDPYILERFSINQFILNRFDIIEHYNKNPTSTSPLYIEEFVGRDYNQECVFEVCPSNKIYNIREINHFIKDLVPLGLEPSVYKEFEIWNNGPKFRSTGPEGVRDTNWAINFGYLGFVEEIGDFDGSVHTKISIKDEHSSLEQLIKLKEKELKFSGKLIRKIHLNIFPTYGLLKASDSSDRQICPRFHNGNDEQKCIIFEWNPHFDERFEEAGGALAWPEYKKIEFEHFIRTKYDTDLERFIKENENDIKKRLD